MEQTQSRRKSPGTISEMKQVCQQWTKDRFGRSVITGSWFNRRILRTVSIYVTYLFVSLGISAHAATLLMTLAGFAGILFCLGHAIHLTVVGGICFMLFDLLDAVDGEIARWNETCSTKGLFLDQVSHVLVEYPSFGVPALHYYLLTREDLYLMLAGTTVVSAVMGRTFREMLFRINAESMTESTAASSTVDQAREENDSRFKKCCNYLRTMPLIAFPYYKGRVVHLATVVAILCSYVDSARLLFFVAWFYAIYCLARSLAQIPHYYWNRLVDARHVKPTHDYRWPI